MIEKLDYLKSTGINAIELLPIFDFPGDHSWGYDPNLISSIESNYGTPLDFKKLVDEAHKRGIAIILDIIWNHIRSSSPLWEIQPDYDLNPYIKIHTELNPNEAEGSWGMLDLDHFNPKMIEYINKVNRIWVDEYKIDGFRFDAMYMIGWLIENTDLSSGWHDSFHDRLKEDIHGQSFSTITYMNQVIGLHEYSNWGDPYEDRFQAVKYMVSHDEQSLIQEMVEYNTFTTEEALMRDRFYATLLFTSQGIPMLFQGQEFGLQTGWTDVNNNGNYDEEKLQYRPVNWTVLETEEGQEHLDYYKKLTKLRKINPTFSKGTFFDLYRYSNQNVIVYGYKDESPESNNDQIVVIANFSSLDREIQDVPFFSNGNWYNVLDPSDNVFLSSDTLNEFYIKSKTAIIFSNKNWSLDLKEDVTVPEISSLITSYPNPFNGRVKLNYFTNTPYVGEIIIYDISGRSVYSFDDLYFSYGNNFFEWNGKSQTGDHLPTGLYFVSVKNDGKLSTHKILYLK